MMEQAFKNALLEAREALDNLIANEEQHRQVVRAAQILADAFKAGGRSFSCGNGGSHCDAMHFAEEMTGRFRLDRAPLGATAISDVSHISCVANDFGFEHVFGRFIEANGRKGDVLLAITTSGSSPNVINAAQVASKIGMKVIAMTGRLDAKIAPYADIHICTPGGRYADRVQELHIKVIHALIELVERQMFPDLYK
jgi:D-sedoheptulose 7-phosphate isomerase